MNPFHELRRALIAGWLTSHPNVGHQRHELERLVLMWLRTPHSTTMMWVDSKWVDQDADIEMTDDGSVDDPSPYASADGKEPV